MMGFYMEMWHKSKVFTSSLFFVFCSSFFDPQKVAILLLELSTADQLVLAILKM